MKKRLPKFKNDREAAKFIEQDLSEYLEPENLLPISFEFAPKNKVVNLRMSEALFSKLKSAAKKRKMPYQKFIREALELSLRAKRH